MPHKEGNRRPNRLASFSPSLTPWNRFVSGILTFAWAYSELNNAISTATITVNLIMIMISFLFLQFNSPTLRWSILQRMGEKRKCNKLGCFPMGLYTPWRLIDGERRWETWRSGQVAFIFSSVWLPLECRVTLHRHFYVEIPHIYNQILTIVVHVPYALFSIRCCRRRRVVCSNCRWRLTNVVAEAQTNRHWKDISFVWNSACPLLHIQESLCHFR